MAEEEEEGIQYSPPSTKGTTRKRAKTVRVFPKPQNRPIRVYCLRMPRIAPSSSSSSYGRSNLGKNLDVCGGEDAEEEVSSGGGGSGEDGTIQMLGLPLGMSMAAVFAEVLDGKIAPRGRMSANHLSRLCTNAIDEALLNVFGCHFDLFTRNFEKSFRSTLKTLRLVKEVSLTQRGTACGSLNFNDRRQESLPHFASNSGSIFPDILDETQASVPESSSRVGEMASIRNAGNGEPSIITEDTQSNLICNLSSELLLHGQLDRQLAVTAQSTSDLGLRESVLGTFERSVREQTRSNDLKEFEIGLTMQTLQLKRSQLLVDSDANLLEKLRLQFGFSKAAFKMDKFNTEMKHVGQLEFLMKCTDCLMGGLLIMLASSGYGVYNYSYKLLLDKTAECSHSATKGWNSWIPNPMSSVRKPAAMLKCYTLVYSRVIFSMLLVLTLIYLLIRRANSSRQAMPITTFILLLGVAMGLSGKFCVDGLGGSGYIWLGHWLVLCSIHAISNIFTAFVYHLLNGPVLVSQQVAKLAFPYWVRRFVFYSIILVLLPLMCGLLPFASLSEWVEHFLSFLPPSYLSYFSKANIENTP